MSSMLRTSTSDAMQMDQLLLENEQLLAHVARLEPFERRCVEAENRVRAIESQLQEALGELRGTKDERDHLRRALSEERETTAVAVAELKSNENASSSRVLGMLQTVLNQLAAANSGLAASQGAAASSQQAIEELRGQLEEERRGKEAALERAAILQQKWDAAEEQSKQMSTERNVLKDEAAAIIAASGAAGAAIAGLVARIFDNEDEIVNDFKSRVAIANMLREQEAETFRVEKQRWLQTKAELEQRLATALELNAKLHEAQHHHSPPGAAANARLRMTLAQGPDGQLTARRGNANVEPSFVVPTAAASPSPAAPNVAPVISPQRSLSFSTRGRLSTHGDPPPAAIPGQNNNNDNGDGAAAAAAPEGIGKVAGTPAHHVTCPRCTLDNPRECRRCSACGFDLSAAAAAAR